MRLSDLDAAASPSEAFEREVMSALQQEFGDRVYLLLDTAKPNLAKIDEIVAEPMRQGLGSRAMQIICASADRHGVALVLEVATEADGIADDVPDEETLIRFYTRFGFHVVNYGFRTVMRREPSEESFLAAFDQAAEWAADAPIEDVEQYLKDTNGKFGKKKSTH